MSRAIADQGEPGEDWAYSVQPVYMVSFLNFKEPKIGDKFRTDVALADMATGRNITDIQRYIYLQLPLFNEDEDACDSLFKCWIYTLKHMDTLARMPFTARNAVFERLGKVAEVAAMTREERAQYDESLREYRDMLGVYQGAVIEGREIGHAEGRIEGLEQGRIEGLEQGRSEANEANARAMKSLGVSTDIIVKVTGLTHERIAEL